MPPTMVEPFADVLDRPDGRFACVGYRLMGCGEALVSVELPIQPLEQAVVYGLDLTTRITPSGEVISEICGWSQIALRSATSIDILVSQVVSPDNLRLEEASFAELNKLLKSLELSVEQVKTALQRTSVVEV